MGSLERVTGENVGVYEINEGSLDSDNYIIDFVPANFNITKADQVITFNPLVDVTIGAPNFDLTATASSGLGITYSSSDDSVVSVSGNAVSIVGPGTATISAMQTGNTNYNAAISVDQNIVVNDVTLGIFDNVKAEISFGIYPNPTEKEIFVNTDTENLIVSIFSLSGVEVKRVLNYIPNTAINVQNLPSAVYILQVKSKQGISYKKFIKR